MGSSGGAIADACLWANPKARRRLDWIGTVAMSRFVGTSVGPFLNSAGGTIRTKVGQPRREHADVVGFRGLSQCSDD
jgi:hypothetical protein